MSEISQTVSKTKWEKKSLTETKCVLELLLKDLSSHDWLKPQWINRWYQLYTLNTWFCAYTLNLYQYIILKTKCDDVISLYVGYPEK